jgi:hypothetical protein
MSDMLKRALNARLSDVLPSPTTLDPAPNLSARVHVSVLLPRPLRKGECRELAERIGQDNKKLVRAFHRR